MGRDTEADFTEFVEARSAALFRTAMALTGHRQQAEDLLQTALAATYRRWRQVRLEEPDAYVRKVMYRQQISWWRRLAYRREVSTGDLPETADTDHTGRVDLRLALHEALNQLAPKHRAVLVLRYLEDLPDAEIADILGCQQVTVRTQVARALHRLRQTCPELGSMTATLQESRR